MPLYTRETFAQNKGFFGWSNLMEWFEFASDLVAEVTSLTDVFGHKIIYKPITQFLKKYYRDYCAK